MASDLFIAPSQVAVITDCVLLLKTFIYFFFLCSNIGVAIFLSAVKSNCCTYTWGWMYQSVKVTVTH